jgi:hypothetical protein
VVAAAGPQSVLGVLVLVDPDATRCPLDALGPSFSPQSPTHAEKE